MLKTKLGVTKLLLTVVLVVALTAAVCLNFAFAEGEPQTREFNANFDRELASVSNGTTGAVAAYRSLSWTAGQCAVAGDHPIYKMADGKIQDGQATALKLEVRSVDESIKLADLMLNIHLSDPLNLASYALNSEDLDVTLSEGTDIGANWTIITIDFTQSEVKVGGENWNSALEGAWAGFHLTTSSDTVAGKLDIRTISILEGETETVLSNFANVTPGYWSGSDEGTYVDVPAHYEISESTEISSAVATSNNTDETYSAIVLRIAGSGSVTVAPIVDGVAGTAKNWSDLTDLEGTAVAALDGTYRNAVISLESLGAKNIQGVKIAVSGGSVNVCNAFFTNLETVVPDTRFPTLDPETITYLSQFNFEYTPEHAWSAAGVEAVAPFNCDYIIAYGALDAPITNGHAVLDASAGDYVNLKIRSKTGSEGKEYLVIKYKLEGREDLATFRLAAVKSDPDVATDIIWIDNLVVGTALSSQSEINPYVGDNGYQYLVINTEKTFGTTQINGVDMYIGGEGKMLIDEIFYCDRVLPKLNLETKQSFDTFDAVPSTESGYWWADISDASKVTAEDGALKISVPANTAVCVGGAKPNNNKDFNLSHMVIRMKGNLGMDTFRIIWLDGAETYFNQDQFKTLTGKPFVLTEEYQDFIIDLDASGINREIEGFRLWLGGWNAADGEIYIDEIYFANKQELQLDTTKEIIFDNYDAVPSTESGYWWQDISDASKVAAEDGALKISVPANTAVCVGGAKPENNKDASYKYMIIRMKGDLDMGTFRITWLDDTTTFFNQGAFKTINGKAFELTNEYQDFIIDLDASGINREIEGFRLWLGGWNATDGTLYIDKISFAPAIGDIVVLPTNDDAKPVIGEVTVPETATAGDQITVSATATDNYGEVTISYKVTLNGAEIANENGVFTATEAGTYDVKVIATDAAGNVSELAKAVAVNAVPNPEPEPEPEPAPEGLSTGAIVGIVVACVAVAAGAVVAVILIRKRKQK